ncbi:MAG TPA: outer membrane beta-barrel protein [Candidatus Omnitrophota bacterium]|nr:outer membrane beta-barrel protein [Candidatus Omnitrophota bacterium]
MKWKFSVFYLILHTALFLMAGVLFAKDIPLGPRDEAMLNTLVKLQRIEIIRDALKEVEMKFAQDNIAEEAGLDYKKIKEEPSQRKPKKESAFTLEELSRHTHPYLKYEALSDDNTNTNRDRRGSFINTFTPGLKMNLAGRQSLLNLDTFIDNIYYNNRSRNTSQEFSLDILNSYSLSRYLLSFSNNYFNNFLTKSNLLTNKKTGYYWKNNFKTTMGRDFNRLGFDIGYARLDYQYESTSDSITNDRTEHTLAFNQYLRLARKTRLLFSYEMLRKNYTRSIDSDGTLHTLSLGAAGSLSGKLTGLAKIIYNPADYKGLDTDYEKTTLSLDLGYKATPRTDYRLIYKRITNDPSVRNDYYRENDFKLSSTHRLAFNPKLQLSFGLELDSFDYTKRNGSHGKDVSTLDFGLSYLFRQWVDFGLDYKYDKSSSKIDSSYHRNKVTFKTQMRF